jgi:hypothetical protein
MLAGLYPEHPRHRHTHMCYFCAGVLRRAVLLLLDGDFVFCCSLSESLVTARATDILEGMLMRGFTTVRDCGEHTVSHFAMCDACRRLQLLKDCPSASACLWPSSCLDMVHVQDPAARMASGVLLSQCCVAACCCCRRRS